MWLDSILEFKQEQLSIMVVLFFFISTEQKLIIYFIYCINYFVHELVIKLGDSIVILKPVSR